MVESGFLLKVLSCVFCGFIIGFERQVHNKPIDIRMSVLICLGTMVFIYLGTLLDGAKDNTRVLGQVVTGVGFLGAGAIFNREGLVVGLTSASVVWMLAAIGSAIGIGRDAIGIFLAIFTVLLMTCLQFAENRILKGRKRVD